MSKMTAMKSISPPFLPIYTEMHWCSPLSIFRSFILPPWKFTSITGTRWMPTPPGIFAVPPGRIWLTIDNARWLIYAIYWAFTISAVYILVYWVIQLHIFTLFFRRAWYDVDITIFILRCSLMLVRHFRRFFESHWSYASLARHACAVGHVIPYHAEGGKYRRICR